MKNIFKNKSLMSCSFYGFSLAGIGFLMEILVDQFHISVIGGFFANTAILISSISLITILMSKRDQFDEMAIAHRNTACGMTLLIVLLVLAILRLLITTMIISLSGNQVLGLISGIAYLSAGFGFCYLEKYGI